MSMAKVVKLLRGKDIKLTIKDGRLRYDAPRGAIDADILSKLKEYKEELYQFARKASLENVYESIALEDINKANTTEIVPLSHAQQRLWFIDCLEGGSSLYNMILSLSIEGELDLVAFEKSLYDIVDRHEILRTHIRTKEGTDYQFVSDSWSLPLIKIDISHLKDKKTEVKRLVRENASLPFNLQEDLLFRVHLIKISEDNYIVSITMHHIVSDGWSVGLFVNELKSLYCAYVQGKPNPLAPLKVQYTDYTQWQRRWLCEETIDLLFDYWGEQLADMPTVHNLPLDKRRPPRQNFSAKYFSHKIDARFKGRIKKLCREQNVTLFIFLQTAYAVLLSRYSNDTDIVMGTPVAGRIHRDLNSTIGFFANTLILRSDLANSPSFLSLLQNNKKVILDAFTFQYMPFDILVDKMKPERSLSHAPLFQILFAMQNDISNALDFPGLSVKVEDYTTEAAKFDLQLSVVENDDGIMFSWIFAESLFEMGSIQRMAESFEVLLEAIIDKPEQRIDKLPLLTASDRRQLELWNQTQKTFPENKCIHELFEAQVQKTPNSVAVVYETHELTYRELNERSNQLANYLVEKGVKPDCLVGLCIDRSIEMLIGLLAVMKAGGAYVTLDPTYPRARLHYILSDAKIGFVLSTESLRKKIFWAECPVLWMDIDDSLKLCSTYNTANIDRKALGLSNRHLVYVIYTSGSTGQPKGVMIEHRSLVNFLKSMEVSPGLNIRDVLLAVTTIAFDIHALELYLPLITGAKLVIAPSESVTSAELLIILLSRHCVTVMQATPSTWKMLLEGGWRPRTPIRVLCGGEACGEDLKSSLLSAEEIELWNMYGPTEATVWCSVGKMAHNNSDITCGPPISNSRFYILNEDLEQIPPGVMGELYIGGTCLARGYLNNSELSSEYFFNKSFSNGSVDRLYRSGDLARWLPNGNMELLGRVDQQVKVRGYRIELGEIETVLTNHEKVRDAVVVIRENKNAQKILAAYVVAHQSFSDNGFVDCLRDHLAAFLPNYMIPSVFVVLENMPLTQNGKVNRKELPIPDVVEINYVEPETEVERQLCRIWQDLLGLDLVSVTANFFQLGGHSLVAIKLLSEVREYWQVALPLKTVFEAQTVRALSVKIESLLKTEDSPITAVSREQELLLSFSQQRLWFVDQIQGSSVQYNIPIVLELCGRLHKTALQRALDVVVERHEVLRTIFFTKGGKALQRINPASSVPLKLINMAGLEETKQKEWLRDLIQGEAGGAFDLTQEWPLRITLAVLSENKHELLFVVHHIAFDAWSLDVMVREVEQLYTAFSTDKPNPLTPLSVQYADYANWQRSLLTNNVYDKQLGYWAERLAGIPNIHRFPLDKPRPVQQCFSGRLYTQTLDSKLLGELNQLTHIYEASLFMVLQSAFALLLGRWSGEEDIVMGCPIAGRVHKEIEPLIGFFANTLVFRTDLSSNPSFSALLAQTRENTLQAFENQEIPFEQLVDKLQPQRSMSHTPVFQILFDLHNNTQPSLRLPNLRIDKITCEEVVAKFDLELIVEQSDTGLELNWVYAESLFELPSIKRLGDSFEVLLRGIIVTPELEVTKLPLLTQTDRQLLTRWNSTREEYTQDKCIHELFEEQAKRTPNAVAVKFEKQSLTYNQLNEQANRLANYLKEEGVKPDSLVGLCVERSLEMMIGLLGILKAGGAYVPVDPGYPVGRIEYMLKDSDVEILLTESHLLSVLPLTDQRTLPIDKEVRESLLLSYSTENIDAQTQGLMASNLAYVIYTSGSTGQPKGVMISHKSALNYLQYAQRNYLRDDIVGSVVSSPIVFDATLTTLYVPLLCGKYVELLPDGASTMELLASCLFDSEYARLFKVTPAHLHLLSNYVNLKKDTQTKHLIVVGGEQLTEKVLRPWKQELLPSSNFVNEYGPTETVVGCCTYEVNGKYTAGNYRMGCIPIGNAIANTKLYVLNDTMGLQPIGAPGELYIAGDGLARGYLNREELTEEKFLNNPFSVDSSVGVYKTGDRVRWLPDGNLEYIGRIDQQVKLLGIRVELGEIEYFLNKHHQIVNAVVTIHSQGKGYGEQRAAPILVAYLVIKQGAVLTSEALKAYLVEQLPSNMIPAAFASLEEIPLTRSGKIDREKLPDLKESNQLITRIVLPSTETERQLTNILRSLLGVSELSIECSLFEIGGNSLIMMQLIAEIKDRFKIEIPLERIFKYPTISKICEYIDASQDLKQKLEPHSKNAMESANKWII